ncbi:MAG: MATE family efflux transporter [Gammaproteobacteria bacterium]|nr:MATE family efflux transporter [Gammaproteobacteria bacterium]MYF60983.1 MATE family efflux transporter [Gammaproteobacteria bacterium]MYI23502.1 MATE family efflux transporter [Gammaproteobacteria bacterium]
MSRRAGGRPFDRSIVEGPVPLAVWMLAWPTMLQNVIAGMQGVVGHAMVGNYVGYAGNAAIGVSSQIYLVVITFVSSLFTGMGILVARFAGAGDRDKVNRTVYQAFLTAAALSIGIVAPLGYFLAPSLLGLVRATAEVQQEALPYLRILFVFSFGTMMFFMAGGAFRAAGDARTPLRLGVALTLLNITFSVILIRGLGPIPSFGTAGAAMGSVISGVIVSGYVLWLLLSHRTVVSFERGMSLAPDWAIIRQLFRFGLPAGIQGVVMNLGGVLLLRFIGSLALSAEAQAAYAVGYVQLFSLITWTSLGLMGATGAVVGQNLGAGHPERAVKGVRVAARIGLGVAIAVGAMFLLVPEALLSIFGMEDPRVAGLGVQLLAFLSVSGLFVTVALTYTGGLQGSGDTRSPLFISIISQVVIPLGLLAILQQMRGLQPTDVWTAILLGHAARCILSVARYRQGKWRDIRVDIGPSPAPRR